MVDVVRARGGLLFYFTRLLLCLSTPDIASSLHLASRVCHSWKLEVLFLSCSRLCGARADRGSAR